MLPFIAAAAGGVRGALGGIGRAMSMRNSSSSHTNQHQRALFFINLVIWFGWVDHLVFFPYTGGIIGTIILTTRVIGWHVNPALKKFLSTPGDEFFFVQPILRYFLAWILFIGGIIAHVLYYLLLFVIVFDIILKESIPEPLRNLFGTFLNL